MSIRRRTRGRHLPNLSPEGRKPVEAYNADQLHSFLVSDAVKGHPTSLHWAVAAYTRIAQLRHQGPEKAFTDVADAVYELTNRPMPHE